MTTDPTHILLVEDSRSLARAESQRLKEQLNMPIIVTGSFSETRKVLESGTYPFLAAVVDLNLPDAPDGEAVNLVLGYKIPTIVLTASINSTTRKLFEKKHIVDYIVKGSMIKFDYVIKLIRRLKINHLIKILIVDDMKSNRAIARNMLSPLNFIFEEAENGVHALEQLKKHPDIRLMLTDQEMPKMNGTELVEQIRKKTTMEELAIIGISSASNAYLNTDFLKAGANGFLRKPYFKEELIATVIQQLEQIENIKIIRKAAEEDFLTELFNRRYFFEHGNTLIEEAKRNSKPVLMAMLDIDHFKKVNDTWGHDVGDVAIQFIARTLKKNFHGQNTLVARIGGEEFAVLSTGIHQNLATVLFEKMRRDVCEHNLEVSGGTLKLSLSSGLLFCGSAHHALPASTQLQTLLKESDKLLYRAKETGRNRVYSNLAYHWE